MSACRNAEHSNIRCSSARARLQPSGSVPTLDRHLVLDAQREPDVSRRHTGLEGLSGRAPRELRQHQITDQRGRTAPELRIDGTKELAASHG